MPTVHVGFFDIHSEIRIFETRKRPEPMVSNAFYIQYFSPEDNNDHEYYAVVGSTIEEDGGKG